MDFEAERQYRFMRQRGLLPDVPGLVRMDRALIYLRQQLDALIHELEQRKTKTLGESAIYRLNRFLAEAVSISALGGDALLAGEIRNSFRELGTRSSRISAIEALRSLKRKVDDWEAISEFSDAEVLRQKVAALEQQLAEDVATPVNVDTSKEDTVFVIMPFSAEFSDVWRGGIQRAAQAEGVRAIRVDMINRSTNITDDIVETIEKCRLAIVDVTGNNPNVMFELGYALAKGKPNIIISQSADYLPFDIRNIRTIVYSNTWSGIEELRTRLQDFLRESSPQKVEAAKRSPTKGGKASTSAKGKGKIGTAHNTGVAADG